MMEQPSLAFPDKQFHMVLQGHVLDCLAKLPSDSIDTIITSPPYWGLRDYKLPPMDWGDWKGQLGLEPDFRLYVRHILQITGELKRVLKPTGCFWLNLGDTYSGSWGNYGNRPEESGIDNGQRERTTDYLERKGHPDTATYPVQVKTGVAPKSLCFIPQRVALAMIDDDSDDIYELKKGYILLNRQSPTDAPQRPRSKTQILQGIQSEVARETPRGLSEADGRMERREPRQTQAISSDILHETQGGSNQKGGGQEPQPISQSESPSPDALRGQSSSLRLLSGEQSDVSHDGSHQRGRGQAHSGDSEGRPLSEHLRVAEGQRLPDGFQGSLYELQSRLGALRYLPSSNGKRRIRKSDIPSDLTECFSLAKENRWRLRNQIVWFKPNGMPSSVRDRFSNRWEPMFFFTKEPRYWFDLDAVREPHQYDGRKVTTVRRVKKPEIPDENPDSFNRAFGERWPNEAGKNPGDVIREPAVRSKSWSSNPGHDFTHDRKYKEGADGTDFWEITTEPHPFAHFAVYPDKLVERPIKASCPAEVCVKCGKARERITEVEYDKHRPSAGNDPRSRNEDRETEARELFGSQGWRGNNLLRKSTTLGWTSCSCSPQQYGPGIVLDPFAGSGTTAVVAKRLQRSSISIELAEHYIPIVKERLDFGHETIDGAIMWIERSVAEYGKESTGTPVPTEEAAE